MDRSALRKSVEEIISDLSNPEQVIVKRLRALIFECLPKAEECNSYGAPFYRHNRMICFVWPASIQWGVKEQKKYPDRLVVLGFCQGNRMSNEDGVLLAEGRKQVYCLYFKSISEIDENKVRALLYEAGMIDDTFGRKHKKPIVKKR